MPFAKSKISLFLSSVLNFLSENWLVLSAGFLLAFIPLYPKLPLFDVIPGYIVRARLEDIFIFATSVGLTVQLIRGRAKFSGWMTWFILSYIAIGFLSVLSALFLVQTVPLHSVHIAKTVLHFFRYIEYFLLFFITYASIKNKQNLQTLFTVLIISTLLVIVYGVGQKYAYWPVWSTMNREFSKGIRLYLTEHARVQSTFGGHYDLSGYLVITIPLILSSIFFFKKRLVKTFFWILFILSVWLLTVSASRISYAAYVLAIMVSIFVAGSFKDSLKEKIKFISSKMMIFGLVTILIFEQFGTDIQSRMLHFLEGFPEAQKTYLETQKIRSDLTTNFVPTVRDLFFKSDNDHQPLIQPPKNAISVDEARQVITKTDTQPSRQIPKDVYTEIPEPVEVMINDVIYVIEKERVYSENAIKYGLSFAIRLDTLWPQALRGFYANPLLGSGYATLTKASKYEFTEADSTDNNFLRTLGETGVLGFITFYGVICIAIYKAYQLGKNSREPLNQIISAGYIGGAIGLLVNATFIDVFAASKVAFIFWGVTGMMLGAHVLEKNSKLNPQAVKQKSQAKKERGVKKQSKPVN